MHFSNHNWKPACLSRVHLRHQLFASRNYRRILFFRRAGQYEGALCVCIMTKIMCTRQCTVKVWKIFYPHHHAARLLDDFYSIAVAGVVVSIGTEGTNMLILQSYFSAFTEPWSHPQPSRFKMSSYHPASTPSFSMGANPCYQEHCPTSLPTVLVWQYNLGVAFRSSAHLGILR